MKVAMVKPPNAGSLTRGVGFYAERLFKELEKLPDLEIGWMKYSPNPFAYQSYDIVHFPYFDLFKISMPPVRVSRTIVTLHDLIPLKFPENFPMGKKAKIVWPLQKKLLLGVDAVITDSKASKKDIEELTKLKTDKIFVTYLASDAAFQKVTDQKRLTDVKTKFNLPDEFALYVGGVNWNKNLVNLVEAVKGSKTNLVLVGKEFTNENIPLDHAELQPFKKLLEMIKDDKNIVRLGFVETNDLAAIYTLASVYVQPSIYEGFGLPLLEALSCGTIAISGDGGSLPEVGGSAAIYTDVKNSKNLGEEINKVISLPKSKRELISEKSIKQAANFSWEKTAHETYDVYQKVLAGI